MQEEEDLGRVGIAFCEGEEVKVVVSDVEILLAVAATMSVFLCLHVLARFCVCILGKKRTFMPSSEKHGGTAEDSSSASERRMGNFSTADMGMSPL